MAFFRWLGEEARPGLVKQYGPTIQIKVPKKDGTWTTVRDESGFVVGDIISEGGVPVDFTDPRSLRVLRADPRYEEVVTNG